ncbi:hypothetical protein ABTZ59_28485 [Streptomyces sp. NPDC094034]|uniref:hypothetical protein n=1 Tax=Streptomyces sp. NPDC094034 TaxID=3155309 RepID=UPI0033209CF9
MSVKSALRRPGSSVLTLGVAAVGMTAVALALTIPASVTSQSPAPKQKPPVVLVHEAFVDASSWSGVIGRIQDDAINPVAQTFMAERAHARITEVDASHAVTLTRPDTVTGVIEQAAKTTAR